MIRTVLAAAAALAAVPAMANPLPVGYEPVRIDVDYRLSDVAAPAGRAALDSRVKAAIARACPAADPRDLSQWRLMQRCRADARASVKEQLAALDARIASRAIQSAAR